MSVKDETLLRQVVIAVASLPADDLPLVAEFVESLQQHRRAETPMRIKATALRAAARRRAEQLRDVPREHLAAQFAALVEDIRAEASQQGTLIDDEALDE